uniref:Uncharacterized protein n=1 Tax=viral metagenome TaxID=1070528 RepID=A0A6M3L3D6_9ZZZZ
MSELLPLARAARRMGVTVQWLKAEAKAGRVPCLQAGTRYIFDFAALTHALSERAAQANGADSRPGGSDAQ